MKYVELSEDDLFYNMEKLKRIPYTFYTYIEVIYYGPQFEHNLNILSLFNGFDQP